MLSWALAFLVIATAAAVAGMSGLVLSAGVIAQIIVGILLVWITLGVFAQEV